MDTPSTASESAENSLRTSGFFVASLFAVFVLAAGLRWYALLDSQVFTDEGARVAAAQPLLQGAVLYRDVVGVGAPGGILFNAAILKVSQGSLAAVRVSYFAISLLSLGLVSWLAWRCYGAIASVVAAALFAVSSFEVYFSGHAMSEPLMSLLALASVAFVAGHFGRAAPLHFAAAGILAVAAGLVKQPGVLVAGAIAVPLALDLAKARAPRAALQNAAALASGAVAALASYLGWLASEGALVSAWHALTSYYGVSNSELHAVLGIPGLDSPDKWLDFVNLYVLQRLMMVGGIVALAWPTAFRGTSDPALHNVLATLALGSAVGVFLLPQDYGSSFAHYWLMAEPWWIVLAASLLSASARAKLRAAPRWVWALSALVVAVIAFREVEDFKRLYADRTSTARGRLRQLEISRALDGFDRVLVLANPIHYFDSKKQPPTEPLAYFLLGDLLFASVEGPDAVARKAAPALEASDALLIDTRRFELIAPLIAQYGFDRRLELRARWGQTRLFRVNPAEPMLSE